MVSVFGVVGVTLAVLAGVILFCLGNMWVEKHYPTEEYDERQRLVQGRASGLSLAVGVLYLAVILVFLDGQVFGEKTVEPYLLVSVGFLLMVIVDHTYCLLGHAALPLSQKPVWCILGYCAMCVNGMVRFFWGLEYSGTLSWVGAGSKPLIFLLFGITAAYLALAHTVQLIRDRRSEKE